MWGKWTSGKCIKIDNFIYKTAERDCLQGNCVGENKTVKYNESCNCM